MSDFRIRQAHSPVKALQRAVEASTIAASLYLSQWAAGQYASQNSVGAIAVAVVFYLIISELSNITSQGAARSANIELGRVLTNWTLTVLCLSLVAFFTRQGDYFARSSILGWMFLTGACLGLVTMLFRIAAEMLFSTGWTRRRCAIAGLNQLGAQLLHNTRSNPEAGLEVVGFYDDRAQTRRELSPEAAELFKGKLDEMIALAKSGQLDTIFVTLPLRAEPRIRWLLDQLADTTCSVYIVPDFFVFELLHSRWNSIGGLPAVSVFESPLYGVDGVVRKKKREREEKTKEEKKKKR
ncbi:MAG TPA: undecaprenyl-phosphate glucose phosphotransferase, partial [Planctomycetaceae bacterium]|nr:undecaprenyl-phosphate glucose phosphotransferase [Planctomycetaceae bacterium]